jgi:hypothetical protein
LDEEDDTGEGAGWEQVCGFDEDEKEMESGSDSVTAAVGASDLNRIGGAFFDGEARASVATA